MYTLIFYSAFLATFLSVTGLTYLAWREHNPEKPRMLSELAATNQRLVNYFRVMLWSCGTVFAITMLLYVVPKVKYSSYQLAAWGVYYGCEVLLGAFPARGIETTLLATMSVLGILTIADRKRFIFLRVAVYLLSHASILVAALALR